MSLIDERNINPIEEMNRVAKDILGLEARGFQETYRSIERAELIYDSEWCRINLIWGRWDPVGGNSMQIRYGRLHALNDKNTMMWQGEKCRCWHRVEFALHFLDKRSPAETAELNYSHPLTSRFYTSEIQQEFNRRQPEWLAEMQLAIWQRYGQRLFDLYDLRKPELWQQYRQFLKEVYDIQGRDLDVVPAMDKVC